MLWVINGEESHQIISCNTCANESTKLYELWVTRPNGKNLKMFQHEDYDEVRLVKDAIDHAIRTKEATLEL